MVRMGMVSPLIKARTMSLNWASAETNIYPRNYFMIELLAIYLAISCPNVKMINRTAFPWNDHDQEVKQSCEKRCPQLYEDAPCLKQFIKYDKQDYDCICGV